MTAGNSTRAGASRCVDTWTGSLGANDSATESASPVAAAAPRPRSTETVSSTAPPSVTDVTALPAASLAAPVTSAGAGSAWASATVKRCEASSVALPAVPEYAVTVTVSSTRFSSLAGGVICAVNDGVSPASVPVSWAPSVSPSVSST